MDNQNFPTANDVPRYTLTRGTQSPNLTYPFESLLPNASGVASPKDQIRDRKDTYTQQWTASVERRLPGSFIGTVSFLGSRGTNIMNRSYINILDPLTKVRQYPQFGQIELGAKDGDGLFAGLQLSVQRRIRRGWLMTGNYMWSHAINDASLGTGVEDVSAKRVLP